MTDQTCAWSDLFDDKSRTNLGAGVFVTGAISTLLGSWLNLALLLTNLRSDRSYRNLAYFTVVACFRRALSVLSYLPIYSYTESFEDDSRNFSCDFAGFWESFLAVYEVECLTHVCIERYVIAKYNTRGWPIQKNHYVLFQSLCIFFASLYSFPPLFGLGRYGLDFSCETCVLDMVLPSGWQRYVVLAIFIFRSIKSTGFMVVMLIWAKNLEVKYDKSDKLMKEIKFTNTAIMVTIVNLACWLPMAAIRGWVVLSYLLFNDVLIRPSGISIQWAIWIHWISPAVTAITMYLVDEATQKKMLNLCQVDENIEEEKKKE